MKRLSFSKKQSKRGMASFYVVIFATILFGVVTVSFIRIILSEATQSSNDDLSRSAYDSAIAGVEDAKTAVNRYYSCINGTGNAGDCDDDARVKLFRKTCSGAEGIGIASYLYGSDLNEVKIQEQNASSGENTSDQAYTCVIVSDEVPDYRGTLTDDTPTKAIPISSYAGDGVSTGTRIGEVDKIRFSWYSRLNEGDISNAKPFNESDGIHLSEKSNAPVPPAIALTFIKASKGVRTEDFHKLSNTDDLVYSTVLLLPSKDNFGDFDKGTNIIGYDDMTRYGNVGSFSTTTKYPFGVKCTTETEFACSVTITGLKGEVTEEDTVMLIVSLPYNDTVTDFAAALLNEEGGTVPFVGVQVQVDSTGRTNQLFRRVEARLDPIDLFFPFPQYELFLEDNDATDATEKNFWITANCWHTHPYDKTTESATDNVPKLCPNNGDVE